MSQKYVAYKENERKYSTCTIEIWFYIQWQEKVAMLEVTFKKYS